MFWTHEIQKLFRCVHNFYIHVFLVQNLKHNKHKQLMVHFFSKKMLCLIENRPMCACHISYLLPCYTFYWSKNIYPITTTRLTSNCIWLFSTAFSIPLQPGISRNRSRLSDSNISTPLLPCQDRTVIKSATQSKVQLY